MKLQCGHELHEECWNQDKEKRNRGCMYCRQGGEQPQEPSLVQLLLLAEGGGGGGGGGGWGLWWWVMVVAMVVVVVVVVVLEEV